MERYVFGEWMWRAQKWRKVQDLPDIATFQVGMERFREAMISLRPVVELANANVREMMEVINAQSQ